MAFNSRTEQIYKCNNILETIVANSGTTNWSQRQIVNKCLSLLDEQSQASKTLYAKVSNQTNNPITQIMNASKISEADSLLIIFNDEPQNTPHIIAREVANGYIYHPEHSWGVNSALHKREEALQGTCNQPLPVPRHVLIFSD